MAWALETYGRVPLEHVVQGSLFSRLWSWGNRILMRPSSPKPAFGLQAYELITPAVEEAAVRGPGEFRLKFRLHAAEDPELLTGAREGYTDV
ncbi:hypothetical protein [Candidatus Poriferisodalis sp.]|uniref:hypothetical protein n=1 Tax=Candidatus Poriferisodalis sp. TaxID=3101277 RepID=UPI003B013834